MKYRRHHRGLERLDEWLRFLRSDHPVRHFFLSLGLALLVLAAAMLLKFLLKKAEGRNKDVIEIPRALTKPLTADEIVGRTRR